MRLNMHSTTAVKIDIVLDILMVVVALCVAYVLITIPYEEAAFNRDINQTMETTKNV